MEEGGSEPGEEDFEPVGGGSEPGGGGEEGEFELNVGGFEPGCLGFAHKPRGRGEMRC